MELEKELALKGHWPSRARASGCSIGSPQCPASGGLYDLRWGRRDIRLIVLNDLTEHPRNAAWELFASEMARIR